MSSRPGDWNCRSCQHLNFQWRESCQRCGEPRAVDYYGSFGGGGRGGPTLGLTGPDVRPGDWYCSIDGCGTHNFASRSTCFRCGARRDESDSGRRYESEMPRARGFGFGGGGSSGGGSGSRWGWRAGDWICTRLGCNEHNFATRTNCFKCNAPRDFSGGRSD